MLNDSEYKNYIVQFKDQRRVDCETEVHIDFK